MAEREVIYRLKVAVDPAAKAQLDGFAKAMESAGKAHSMASQGAQAERQSAAQSLSEKEKQEQVVNRAHNRAISMLEREEQIRRRSQNTAISLLEKEEQHRNRMQGTAINMLVQEEQVRNRAQGTAQVMLAKEEANRNRAHSAAIKLIEKEGADRKRAIEQAEAAQSLADRKLQASNDKIIAGVEQGVGAVTQLARAYALFGAANEKDMEKAVRMLARFEGGVQLVTGIINAAQAGITIWKGYAESVAAAVAAQEALAAASAATALAQTASAATATRGAATGVAGAGVAGAVGGAGGAAAAAGTAGTGAVGAGLVALAPAIGIAVAIVGALTAILAFWNKDFREGLLELVGWTDKAGDLARRNAADEERRRQTDEDMNVSFKANSTYETSMRRLELEFAKDPRSVAQQQLVFTRMRARQAEDGTLEGQLGQNNKTFQDARSDALKDNAEASRALYDIEQERYREAQRAGENALALEKQRTSELRSLAQQSQQLYQTEKQRLMSAEERLAQMSPVEIQRISEASRRAQMGLPLDWRQAQQLRGLPGAANETAVEAATQRRLKDIGADGILKPQRAVVEELGRRAIEINTKVEAQLKQEITIKLDSDKMLAPIKQALEGAKVEFAREVAKVYADVRNRQINDHHTMNTTIKQATRS